MKSKLLLRPWGLEDTKFALSVRNNKELQKWFRQDKDLTLGEQYRFIQKDLNDREYGGLVVEWEGKKVGLCGVKYTDEFTIGILPNYQHQGIALATMKALLRKNPNIWSEVFVGNPALEFFIAKCGFKVVGVKERAYYKKELGMVDTVKIAYGTQY